MLDLSKGHIEFSDSSFSPQNWAETDSEAKVTFYEELFSYAMIMRANKKDSSVTIDSQEKVFPYIKYIIEWLRTSDFYTAPASTKYHDSCYGGLLHHTLEVYNQLVGLKEVPKFKKVVSEQWWSAVFAVLVHDWCKIGRYESYIKNVKNDNTGEWEKVPAFKWKEDGVVRFGHGAQSLIMAIQLCNSKYTSLTVEEMAAIRWHMGNWDTGDYDTGDLRRCDEMIPMVHMVQFADQLSITSY